MPREILTDWTTPAGGGFVTVTFWDEVPDVADQRAAWADFLTACGTSLVSTAAWTVRQSGRVMDDTTGILTDEWTDATGQLGTGANVGEPVPDSSQILVRWNTAHIVNGRFLRGRTYLPGASIGAVDDGNLLAANVLAISDAAADLIATATGLGVWHRPVNKLGGEFRIATTAACWAEFAVLRQRRQ